MAANSGGNLGDAVGSVQADAFASHSHSYVEASFSYVGSSASFAYANGSNGYDFNISAANTADAGSGHETRPVNAGVNFIIEY